MTPQDIIAIINRRRYVIDNEKSIQRQLAENFADAGLVFEREKKIDEHNIIDFLFEGGIGIEIKIKGGARAIYKQCERYCEFEQINQLILITAKSVGLPLAIGNKSTHVYNLNRSWL